EVSPEETEGHLIYELGNGQWNIPRLRELLRKITGENTRIDDFRVQHDFPHLGPRSMVLNARRVQPNKGMQLILLAIEDVTDREKHIAAIQTQSALIEMAHETIIVRNFNGTIRFWNRGAEEMYGWKKEEVLGKTKQEVLRPKFSKSFD